MCSAEENQRWDAPVQRTYTKVTVISLDIEDDKWKKRGNVSACQIQGVEVEHRKAHSMTPCSVTAWDDTDVTPSYPLLTSPFLNLVCQLGSCSAIRLQSQWYRSRCFYLRRGQNSLIWLVKFAKSALTHSYAHRFLCQDTPVHKHTHFLISLSLSISIQSLVSAVYLFVCV